MICDKCFGVFPGRPLEDVDLDRRLTRKLKRVMRVTSPAPQMCAMCYGKELRKQAYEKTCREADLLAQKDDIEELEHELGGY